jgi:hypothetical protein
VTAEIGVAELYTVCYDDSVDDIALTVDPHCNGLYYWSLSRRQWPPV